MSEKKEVSKETATTEIPTKMKLGFQINVFQGKTKQDLEMLIVPVGDPKHLEKSLARGFARYVLDMFDIYTKRSPAVKSYDKKVLTGRKLEFGEKKIIITKE